MNDLAQALDLTRQEGSVVRIAGSFPERDIPIRVGKYVRAGHVQSETHRMKAELVASRLAQA